MSTKIGLWPGSNIQATDIFSINFQLSAKQHPQLVNKISKSSVEELSQSKKGESPEVDKPPTKETEEKTLNFSIKKKHFRKIEQLSVHDKTNKRRRKFHLPACMKEVLACSKPAVWNYIKSISSILEKKRTRSRSINIFMFDFN